MVHHKTWWGESFVAALEGFIDSGRLSRGRAYRTDNRVLKYEQNANHIKATIRGNINPYFGVTKEPKYKVDIKFKTISKKQWDEAIAKIGSNAAWLSKLILNEIPDDIDLAFTGSYLLPKSYKDVEASCSCPDWDNPCKHIAGIYYRVSNLLDSDPMLLFSLRGLPPEVLVNRLKETELGTALSELLSEPEDVELTLEDSLFHQVKFTEHPPATTQSSFWEISGGDEINEEETQEANISAAIIKKQGDYPPFWSRHNSFIAVMDSFYDLIRRKHKKVL